MKNLSSLSDFIKTTHKTNAGTLDDASNNLVAYLAESMATNSKYEKIYLLMMNRVSGKVVHETYMKKLKNELKILAHESAVFGVRFDLLASNNQAYRLATTIDPTVDELEMFAYIKPCWSTLFPIKLYLLDHPKQAREYRGLVPFGSEVIKFYNSVVLGFDVDFVIDGSSPTLIDHCRLQHMTNRYADLLGMTSVAINTMMYMEAKSL